MKELILKILMPRSTTMPGPMTAFSVAVPLCPAKPWQVAKIWNILELTYGSIIAPTEFILRSIIKLEFKILRSVLKLQDYDKLFSSFLTLLFRSKAEKEEHPTRSRIDHQGAVAVEMGWDAPGSGASGWAFWTQPIAHFTNGNSSTSLGSFSEQLRLRHTPADELLEMYREKLGLCPSLI